MRKKLKLLSGVLFIYLILSLKGCDGERKYALLDFKSRKVILKSDKVNIESFSLVSTGPDTIVYIETLNKNNKSISFKSNTKFKKYFFDSIKFTDTVLKDYTVYMKCRNLKTDEPKFFIEHFTTNQIFSIRKKISNQGYI